MSITFDVIGQTIPQDERMAKSEKFRLDIRRKQKQDKFKSIRKQFAQSLKSLDFLEQLKSERDNFNVQKIRWVLEGLSVGLNNSSFYQEITNLELEPYFCDMILNNELNIEQKSKILRTLVEFLYFNNQMPNELYKNNSLLDYLCETLGKLNIENEQEENFAEQTLNLVQNLLYFKNEDFANFLMGSDIFKITHQFINTNNDEKVYDKRVTILKIYKNLFRIKIEPKFVANSLRIILQDEKYYNKEQVMRQTLRCLKLIIQETGIWSKLSEFEELIGNGLIDCALVSIFTLIQDNFSAPCFSLFLSILSELLDDEDTEEQAIHIINDFTRSNFLLSGLKQINNMENNQQNNLYICQAIKMIARARMLKLSEFVYTSFNEHEDFLKFVMKRQIVTNPKFNKYLMRLLSRMLEQNNTSVGILKDYGVMDVVCDSLNNEFNVQDKFDIIELVERLIWAEEDLRDKNEKSNRIDNIFYERGVIQKIENMQDDPNQIIFKRAQLFMKRHSQIKREQN